MSDSKNMILDFVAEGFQQGWKHIDASRLAA